MASICLISLSPVARDPRVLRHAEALAQAGHKVVVAGYGSADEQPDLADPAGIRLVLTNAPGFGPVWRLGNLLRVASGRFPLAARALFWTSAAIRDLWRQLHDQSFDLVIANDWNTLPLSGRLARRSGAALIYDSHEYGRVERIEDRRWRLLYPPLVSALEDHWAKRAAAVVTVSDSIAGALQRDIGLANRPVVIRNLPRRQTCSAVPRGEGIAVLWHGAIGPGRGLEALIDSVALWRPEFRLIIRGPAASEDYRQGLQARAEAAGDRVSFEPGVAVSELVPRAASADIGIHPLPGLSLENDYALPNKLFEYVMAGLAICATDLSEMGDVIRRYELGRLIEGPVPTTESIAAAVNGFSPQDVTKFRAASKNASGQLCWETEKGRWVELCETVMGAVA